MSGLKLDLSQIEHILLGFNSSNTSPNFQTERNMVQNLNKTFADFALWRSKQGEIEAQNILEPLTHHFAPSHKGGYEFGHSSPVLRWTTDINWRQGMNQRPNKNAVAGPSIQIRVQSRQQPWSGVVHSWGDAELTHFRFTGFQEVIVSLPKLRFIVISDY